jgi:hypothetical protein
LAKERVSPRRKAEEEAQNPSLGLGSAKEELEKLMARLFERYGLPYVYEHQIKEFLRLEGFTDRDIQRILREAESYGIIGVTGEPVKGKVELVIWLLSDEERRYLELTEAAIRKKLRRKAYFSTEELGVAIEEESLEEQRKRTSG